MPNLWKLKLGFDANGADQHGTIPVGIEHLSGLKDISAKIGGTDADEPDRISAESALSDTIRMHPGCHTVNIQRVDRMFGGKDDENSGIQVEEHRTLQKQYKIMEEDSNEQHGVLQKDANKHAHGRFSTLLEREILLLLINKLNQNQDDIERLIPVIDVYSVDPWQLPGTRTKWKMNEYRAFQYGAAGATARSSSSTATLPNPPPQVTYTRMNIATQPTTSSGPMTRSQSALLMGHGGSPSTLPRTSPAKAKTRPAKTKTKTSIATTAFIVMFICRLRRKPCRLRRKPWESPSNATPTSEEPSNATPSTPVQQNTQTCAAGATARSSSSTATLPNPPPQLRSETSLCRLYTKMIMIPRKFGAVGSAGDSPAGLLQEEDKGAGRVEAPGVAAHHQGSIPSEPDTRKTLLPHSDGHSWRKYGQKDILGARHPRSYYRCTYRNEKGCQATKSVQRTDDDPELFDVIYHGTHNCAESAHSLPQPDVKVGSMTNSLMGYMVDLDADLSDYSGFSDSDQRS